MVDAASQRSYVFGIYIALWAWKLYTFYNLHVEDEKSVGSVLMWAGIDMCFMFGIPVLDIPWLQWSNGASLLLFIVHAAIDTMLMLRIGLPVQAWFVSLLGFWFDSELAISERSVKPGRILLNESLILGKQIINILPEGYVSKLCFEAMQLTI